MTLKPAPVQVPLKPASSPSGLSGVWTEENRNGLSIEGIGVNAKSGLSSISPSVCRSVARLSMIIADDLLGQEAAEIQPILSRAGSLRNLDSRHRLKKSIVIRARPTAAADSARLLRFGWQTGMRAGIIA